MKKIIIMIFIIILMSSNGFAGFNVKNQKNIINKPLPQFTVIIDSGNGERIVFQIDSGQYINHQRYFSAEPKKNGYVFLNWICDLNFKDKPITQDSIIITAEWITLESYKLQQDSIQWAKIQPSVEKIMKPIKSTTNLLIIFVVILVGFVIFISIFLYFQINNTKKFRNKVLNLLVKEDGQRMKLFIQRCTDQTISTNNSENQHQASKIDEQQFRLLFDKHWEDKQLKVEEKKLQMEPIKSNKPQSLLKKLYANSIKNDNSFAGIYESSNENTTFELDVINGSATFTIFKGNESRVLKRPELVSRSAGIDLQQSGNSKLEVIPGKAQVQNGKWIVKTNAIVKIL